jgi:anti-sigma factor RsiW
MTHLNDEQIAELLAASPRGLAADSSLTGIQAHASDCPECSAEIARMKDSLALFREVSTAFADAHLKHVPAWKTPSRRLVMLEPVYWFAAAAALALAAFIPLHTAIRNPAQPMIQVPVAVAKHATAETDDALLQDVNRDLSESVPTPMEALADPTGSAPQSSQKSTQRTN